MLGPHVVFFFSRYILKLNPILVITTESLERCEHDCEGVEHNTGVTTGNPLHITLVYNDLTWVIL